MSVDVTVATDLLDRAQGLIRAGRPRAARDLLAALGDWRGADVLPDDEGEWLQVHRERVDALYAAPASSTVEAAIVAGDRPQAVAAAELWVAAAPLDERAHRALVAALDAAGDRAGAVRATRPAAPCWPRSSASTRPGRRSRSTSTRWATSRRLSAAPVPQATTSFVGRAEEIAAVAAHLAGPGLVTVAGPAGVGKSRVAAEVVHGLRGQGRPVRWVPLESVTQDALVPATVALALGLSPGDDPVASVVAELAPYGRLVLVLDGCEAALDGAATLAGELVTRCPQLTLVATSRVPLGLQAEAVERLEPWSMPGEDESWSGPALDLLAARAGVGAGSVERADRAMLGGLLRHCGGIPSPSGSSRPN